MKTPLHRMRRGVVFLLAVFVMAVVGFRLIGGEKFDWVQSVYFVVITISSVGFGEDSDFTPQMKLFTAAVIVLGMSAAGYAIGGLLQMMTQGEIAKALGHRRMTRGIGRLKRHVIICGFGRMGQILARDLGQRRQACVIIDHDAERIDEAAEEDYLAISGDATEEHILLDAGVERAKALVTGLPSDAANVFITLTSRNLNPDIQIIARAEFRSSEKKLVQAGADRVVMPASIGAQRMARMITRPSTADLMEQVADGSILDVEFDEVTLSEGNPLLGSSVREVDLRKRFHLLVVAVKKPDGSMHFNPDAHYVFQPGDTVIVMGKMDDTDRFRKECGEE